jgi:RND family efflux transporter MFP subunit
MTLAAALAAWTVRRIAAAETARDHAEPTTASAPTASSSTAAPRAQTTAPEVNLVVPVKATWSPQLDIEGTLAPQQSVRLAFAVAGKLSWLRAKVGDQVESGARLAGLSTSQADSELAATSAHVRAASLQLALADDSATRASVLFETGSHSQAAAVQSTLQKAMASAQLDAARAQSSLAQVSLYEHTLRAPFAGTIVDAPEGIGAVISPGQPLFQLVDLTTLKLAGTVSEADAGLIRVGARVVVTTENGPVVGRIRAVLPALEERTRRVPIEAEFDHPGSLRAGALVRARVEAAEPVEVLRLPHDALRPGSQNEVVVLVPGSPTTLAVRSIGYVTGSSGELLVRSGISTDDAVVVRPGPDAKSGDRVSIAKSDPETHAP